MNLQININQPDLSYEEIVIAKKALGSLNIGYSERLSSLELDLVSKYKTLLRLEKILKELNEMGFYMQQI